MEKRVQLDGSIVWGFAIDLGQGVRLRLSLDDWENLGFSTGQRIQFRISDRVNESLIVTELVEVPPVVWVMLTHRLNDERTVTAMVAPPTVAEFRPTSQPLRFNEWRTYREYSTRC